MFKFTTNLPLTITTCSHEQEPHISLLFFILGSDNTSQAWQMAIVSCALNFLSLYSLQMS